MPATLANIVSIIQRGTAQDLRKALAQGFAWPKEPARHPVFDLLDEARLLHTRDLQLPEKLEALIDHGMPVDFSLPFGASIPPSRQEVVHLGIPDSQRGRSNQDMGASLLVRVAGLGRADLIDVLMRRGATDVHGAAKNMAARFGKLDALHHLLAQGSAEDVQWGAWAPSLLQRRSDDKQTRVFELLSTYLPSDKEGLARALRQLTTANLRQGIMQWLAHDPAVWGRFHDQPAAHHAQGWVPSLWPHVLTARSRQDYPHVFQQALAHMRDVQPAWRTLPVSYSNDTRWVVQQKQQKLQGQVVPGMPGWEWQMTLLPVLQTLLHGHDRLPRSLGEYRNWARDARALQRAGCTLWVDGGERGQPHTEQTLWALTGARPNVKWLAKHPQFMAAHCETGITPLHAVRDIGTADHWINCGADPRACDKQGNQAFASLIPLAIKSTSSPSTAIVSPPARWAGWICDGWKQGRLPIEGQAWGASIAELACSSTRLFAALPARSRRAMPHDGQGLHWAALSGQAGIIEKLLPWGHDTAATDIHGRTPLACLAMGSACGWGGADERAFTKCVNMALDGQWPEVRNDGDEGPWQLLLQAPMTQRFFEAGGACAHSILFTYLKGKRVENPGLWQARDTTRLLQWFQDPSQANAFQRFIQDFSQPIIDDLLLALHDPARWPENLRISPLAFGPRLVEPLLAKGADYEATSLEGQRLVDGWERLEAAEQSATGKQAISNPLTQGYARAVMEQQRMEQDSPTAPLVNPRRMRL